MLYHPAQGEAYQENLFTLLRTRSSIPLPKYLQNRDYYVEDWRKVGPKVFFLRKAWKRAVSLGIEKQSVESAETEEEWVEVLKTLNEWEDEQDKISPRGYQDE